MSDVNLFVGAKCERRDGIVVEIVERGEFLRLYKTYQFKDDIGNTYTEDGEFVIGKRSELDIVKVLNPEADPDLGERVLRAVTTHRTAPPELPNNLRECWERCAFGFKPSPEELRALWSLAGFPLPSPRLRCNDCNCTGRVDGIVCPTCRSIGYLPVEE